MDAGSLSWLDDFLKNYGSSKTEQVVNILSRLSPVLGGAAGARNTQQNTQIGQLLAQERLKQTGPATRLSTGIRAALTKNAQPVTNNFRPGTGQAVKFSGGLTPEALGPEARQLADQVMHQTITDQLAGDTVPQITESGPLDKALGIGSTIAGIGGALTAKSPQQQIVQSILDRLKPTPPPNYGDVGSTTTVPGNATVPDPAMLAGGPAASYGVDSATQAALPGAVENPAGAMPFTPESGGFNPADSGSDMLGPSATFAEPATTYGVDAATQAALPGAVDNPAGSMPFTPETGGMFAPDAVSGLDSATQAMLPGAVDNPAGAMPFTPESGGFDPASYDAGGADPMQGVIEGAGAFAEPATTYGIDAATQAALPGAVDLGSELPGLIDYGSQTTVPELAGAGAGAAGQAGQSILSRLGGPIPIISGITSGILNKDPMMGVADFILPGMSSIIKLLGMTKGGQDYAPGYGYGPGLTPPPAGSAVDTGASSSVLDDNGNPIFTEGNTNLKTAKEAMDAGFSNDPTQGY